MKNKFLRALAPALAACMLLPGAFAALTACGGGNKPQDPQDPTPPPAQAKEGDPIVLQKSIGGNPIGGFGVGDSSFDNDKDTTSAVWQKGEKDFPTYGGDPAILVDTVNGVETAYLYVGHDTTEPKNTDVYTMPEWICYSSTDLKTWKTERIILDMNDIPWANNKTSAWASQVIKYEDYYWFLFCTGYNGTDTAMCIGAAVSESPTGPFKCYDQPLVMSSTTNTTKLGKSAGDAGWNDIDPTGWVTSEGEFYIAWGNTNCFLAQVEMVEGDENETDYNVKLEIVDRSASKGGEIVTTSTPEFYWYDEAGAEENADIMRIDLSSEATANNVFTEAPYIYMRKTTSGFRYYMIYAAGWREALAYSYIDVTTESGLWEANWHYGNRLMDPTATSNTNHPAVFDFGGKTYMVYHNGSLPYGLGFRRVACIAELEFSDNGFINFVAENSTGLDGVNSKITQNNIPIGHMYTVNPHEDVYYPLTLPTFYKAASAFENEEDALWEIEAAKYVPAGGNKDEYISIQAFNMAGLYLKYDITTGNVCITQDDEKPGTAESDAKHAAMSFRTVTGANGTGVMFQCAANANYYLAIVNGELTVTNSATAAQRTFRVETQTANRSATYAANEG